VCWRISATPRRTSMIRNSLFELGLLSSRRRQSLIRVSPGIATGLVVVGNLVGAGAAQEVARLLV
jgi:hypothetical protein